MDTKHKAINWTALATALLTAAGSVGYTQFNADDKDNIKTKVAAEFAAQNEWRRAATEDIKELKEELRLLREAIVQLRVRASRSHHRASRDDVELSESLEPVGSTDKPPRVSKAPKRAAPEQVQEQKALMFAE